MSGIKQKIFLILVALILSSCSPTSPYNTENNKPYQIYKSTEVSQLEFQEDWAFTVSSGWVECYGFDNDQRAWFFKTPSGISYPVNGIAKGAANLYNINNNDIYEIWASHPEYPEINVNIGPFIRKGNEICG